MKIFSLVPKVLLLGALFVGVTTAASGDLWSWMDSLSPNTQGSFGYASSQKISVSQITSTKVVISSPKIQDDIGNDVKTYIAMYSQSPMSAMLSNTSLIDQSKEKVFTFTTVTNPVFLELNAVADTIDPTQVYYLTVLPKDDAGILGDISDEVRFKLSDQTSGEGVYTGSDSSTHGAAGADMNLANVTHVKAGNQITLRWTAVNGSDKVDIFLFNPTSQVFTKLSTVNMSDEKYSFTATRNGEFIVKFMPNNGGREKVYTFTIDGLTATKVTPGTTTVIKKVPHVGPAENVLVALFLAFVLYLLYRRNTLKRK